MNRTPEKIGKFFEGLDILEPDVVSVAHWNPDNVEVGKIIAVDDFCGVGRKP